MNNFMSPEEFLRDAKPSDLFQKLQKFIESPEYQREVAESHRRERENYAILEHQVVGAEIF